MHLAFDTAAWSLQGPWGKKEYRKCILCFREAEDDYRYPKLTCSNQLSNHTEALRIGPT